MLSVISSQLAFLDTAIGLVSILVVGIQNGVIVVIYIPDMRYMLSYACVSYFCGAIR